MTLTTRALTDDDAEASLRLSLEAFGGPPRTDPANPPPRRPGLTAYGVFDGDELVAKVADREYDTHFGGALLPTSGIAGVTVVAERRGSGLLGTAFAAALDGARQRGAVLSTLFPTIPSLYRHFGYESIADYIRAEVPTTSLAAVADPGEGVRTRRATAADFDAVRSVYDAWAGAQNGPLSRRGASFTATAQDFIDSFTGVTVAVDGDDRVLGYASWNRGTAFGAEAAVDVADLIATSAPAAQALLRMLGGFTTVVGKVRFTTSGFDLIRTILPTPSWKVDWSLPYMLRLLDVPGAMAPLRFPRGLTASLPFRVEGDRLGWLDGGYVLDVADGRGECKPGEVGREGLALTSQGLALLYAGALSLANIRASGHARGDAADDEIWDALFGGRQPHIRDYF